MSCSKTKFKGSDDKASPCFKPFLIGTCQMFAYLDSSIGYIPKYFN